MGPSKYMGLEIHVGIEKVIIFTSSRIFQKQTNKKKLAGVTTESGAFGEMVFCDCYLYISAEVSPFMQELILSHSLDIQNVQC